MKTIPHNDHFDSTLAFRRDPYRFISTQCRTHGTDVFQTRLLLQRTICLTGPEGAQLFYDENRFSRKAAPPGRIQKTLFGKGGVQGLDDRAHLHRKEMFLSVTSPERVTRLVEICGEHWRKAADKWRTLPRVELYSGVRELLTRTVCEWAGVPLPETEVERRIQELTALFDAAGAVGPRHWKARADRKRADHWIEGVVEDFRAGRIAAPEQSALSIIARHGDLNGNLLPAHVAAVELLNVLRPTVAVSVFIVFVALALHQFPECRAKILEGGEAYAEAFAQEVRRFYPFFPAAVARVRHDFEWHDFSFAQGTRVILDLYGTDRDSRAWEAPERFRPERFLERMPDQFSFIPQGGGDTHTGHRCPGEGIAVALMKQAAVILTGDINYHVPEQDLSIDYTRLPALPRSRFQLKVG